MSRSRRPPAKPDLLAVNFDERPFTVAWELTRSCALACRHCRAEAQPKPDPRELTTSEALEVVEQLVDLSPAVLVLTGGDPMMRRDLFEIVEHAVQGGLRVAVSPTATALTTRARLQHLRDLGVSMVHISLDGACADTHDAFRGFSGTFQRSLEILADCQALQLPVQIGTTVTRTTAPELPLLAEIAERYDVRMWNCFYLVPTGRGRADEMLDPVQAEQTWEWLAELSESAAFGVRTTAAPQFRRVSLQRRQRTSTTPIRMAGAGYAFKEAVPGAPAGTKPDLRGVNDGKGFMFIDRIGNICPSGFLQLPAGNVRDDRIESVYRDAELFRRLRDPSALEGRCGRCPYADLCGGSRARAYGVTGSYLADDPLCTLNVPPPTVLPAVQPEASAGARAP
ncbi:MAG TPA: TIGR04053 family radical SAM/SPASM domain-containing protein [Dehalococcoidia bacterium]|nr:TIGR04053 family radical SAM/SPASM domain-containing protein [Dehalococcoidia bacterium]